MLHRGSCRGRRATLAATTLAVVLLVLTAKAGANVYHVDGCRTPAGQVAPTDGWSATTVGTTVQATDSCAGGGSLDAIIGGSVVQPANSTSATWTYTAPPQTTIAAAILWRSATTASVGFDANSITFLAAPLNLYDAPDVFDRCFNCTALGVTSSPFDPSNRVAAPAVNVQGASQIFATAECGGTTGQTCPTTGSGSTAPPDAELSVYATDIALNDSSTPTFAGVTGTLASASTLAGTEGIAFAAADTGPGLYQVLFQIDGATVATRQIDDNGGHCVNVGGTSDGTPAFLYGQPCVASAAVSETLDTSQVADGTHHLVVVVTDASGDAATVLDRQVVFHNAAAVAPTSAQTPAAPSPASAAPNTPNGNGASRHVVLSARWKQTTHAALISPWNTRRQITGRLLTASKKPIVGARIKVLAQPAYAGAVATAAGTPITGANGGFSLTIPAAASSRKLVLRYYAYSADKKASASATLTLEVPASVHLTVSPSTSSVGHEITFRGLLHGTPIPTGGKQLLLEARQPGGAWIEFRDIRTDHSGRFKSTYRFRFSGPASYQFRALCSFEADFPFLQGASNVVAVHER